MPDALLLEELQRAGLTRNEAKVYLVLIEFPGLFGGVIAKKATLDRSLTYTLLNNLIGKGFVSYATHHKQRQFFPTAPENLLTPVEEREQRIRALLPKLHAISPKTAVQSTFHILEGIEGMKTYARMLLAQKNVLSFGGTGKFYDLMLEHTPHFAREAKQRKLRGRIIGSKEFPLHAFNKEIKVDVRVLPATSPATTVVCEEFVAIHLVTDQPFAVIIRNPEVVEGYKNYFEFLWDVASVPTRRDFQASTRHPRARTRAGRQARRR